MKHTLRRPLGRGARWLVVALVVGAAPALAQTGAPLGRWVSLGPTKISNGGSGPHQNAVGRITSIAVNPSFPDLILAGARGTGVWRSLNGGITWSPVADELPTLTVSALAFAPSEPTRAYLATPLGIFRSEFLGDAWNHVFQGNLWPMGFDDGKMIVDPNDADRVYLSSCAGNTGGVYRSRDGGVTWDQVLSGGCNTSLEIDPADPLRLLAALTSDRSGQTGLFETSDGGDTWRARPGCAGAPLPPLPEGVRIKIAQSGNVRWVTYYTGDSLRVFRAPGKTCGTGDTRDYLWESQWTNPAGPGNWFFQGNFEADPNNANVLYLGGVLFYRSIDGGATFSLPSPQIHVDQHAFAFHPFDSAMIYAGSDGGVYRSKASGASGTWEFWSEGLANVEYYDLADVSGEPRRVFGATQDNGVNEYDGTSTVWREPIDGDAEAVDVDPINNNVRYRTFQRHHELVRTTNNFVDVTPIGAGLPDNCWAWGGEYPANPSSQFFIHPLVSSQLFVACGSLWAGLPWAAQFTPTVGSLLTVTVDGAGAVVWSGATNGRIFAAPAGLPWRELFAHPFGWSSTDLETDPTDPTLLYASFSGTSGAGRIFRLQRFSTDPTFVSARDITANLPGNVLVKALAIDRLLPMVVFAGTDHGVFRGTSADNGVTWSWSAYNNGIPAAVDVRDLEVHPKTGVMRAATFGRGIYEVQTDWPIGSLAAVEGRITLLRVHNVGTGYGPPDDFLDAEVIVQLDSKPGYAFGFQLRNDGQGAARKGELDRLRDAFRRNTFIHLDYVRTGFRQGRVTRVWNLP